MIVKHFEMSTFRLPNFLSIFLLLCYIVNVLCIILMITIPHNQAFVTKTSVNQWALRFGKDIYEGNAEATCLRKIDENYHAMRASVRYVSCQDMLSPMKEMVENMFTWKRDTAQKIAAKAEREAQNAIADPTGDVIFVNGKRLFSTDEVAYTDLAPNMKDFALTLKPHPIFRNVPVSIERSAVHIPVNVVEETAALKEAIRWSERLHQTFVNNRNNDSELNWQFFCSKEGFLRYFPAAKWRVPQFLVNPKADDSQLDLYDCRLREWYVKAAASPKDIVILLDGSGSMTGQRKEIAMNLVASLLDTLTDDDYVTVIRFSEELEPVLKCFGYNLVEANKQNIQLFKDFLSDLNTTEIADFEKALVKAFEILQDSNRSGRGSQCNQAIMLITDGAPDTYKRIFEKYNYPRISIRVFTYLVGKEVTETKEVNLMACENLGYYTQVSSLSEIRDLVQLYLPVMSRPLVLSGHRVFRTTGVYADITDVPLTPWIWDEREKEKVRKILAIRQTRETSVKKIIGPSISDGERKKEINGDDDGEGNNYDGDDDDAADNQDEQEKPAYVNESISPPLITSSRMEIRQKYKIIKRHSRPKRQYDSDETINNRRPEPKGVHELMVTIAIPVFDVKNTTNVTERFLIKNVWRERVKEVRSANLLGVAGIDIPVREIVRRTSAFKLGVNGYSFAVNNNGHILFHPDLRPLFQDLLKPFYTSVDLSEVEIPLTPDKPRAYNESLLNMRNYMVSGHQSRNILDVKMHIDSMKRAVTRQHVYCHQPISDTLLSLAISLPLPYGEARVDGEIEIKRRDENYTHYFRGDNWRVHPDWVYCDNENLRGVAFDTPEGGILHFLTKAAENESNIWYLEPSRQPPVRMPRLTCEKELVRSLVFDAKATDIDTKRCGTSIGETSEKEVTNLYGITMTFVSTRSGLSRFEDHRSEEEKSNPDSYEREFMETHTRAIDELYYQRAVDYNRFNSSAFLFSVPFNAGDDDGPIYLTASRAIFLGQGKTRAPAGVVGSLIKHQHFTERFFNFSTNCREDGCKVDCASNHTDCYLLDNNGFVMVTEDVQHKRNTHYVGRFFGEIDYGMFEKLIERGVYKQVKMFDYQAICIDIRRASGPGSRLQSPFSLMKSAIFWFWSKLSVFLFDFYFHYLNAVVKGETFYGNDSPDSDGIDFSRYIGDIQSRRIPPNKTIPYPCDKEFSIYEMYSLNVDQPISGDYKKCDECNEEFIVQPVPFTNMIILVLSNECGCEASKFKINPTKITYHDECSYEKRRWYKGEPMPRRMPNPKDCRNFHPEEREIRQCGLAIKLSSQPLITILVITFFHLICIKHLLDMNVNKLTADCV